MKSTQPKHSLFEAVPRRRQVAVVFFAAFLLQLLCYHEAFRIQPSGDDFILPGQIRIGEATGPLSFFGRSPLADYRPLQSLIYWSVSRTAIEDPFLSIHVLNFASFTFYAAVVAGWTMLLRMSLLGTLCTALLLSLHPILAGPLADLDGFTRLVVSAWVWLGTYFAVRFANDLRRAVPLAAMCLLVGLLFMEYALALMPLAVLGLWWARDRKRFLATTILSAALLSVFVAYYLLRTSVVGSSTAQLTLVPGDSIRNFAMLLGGVASWETPSGCTSIRGRRLMRG